MQEDSRRELVHKKMKKAPSNGAFFYLTDGTKAWPGKGAACMSTIRQAHIIREAQSQAQQPKRNGEAHGGVCATESALIRSRLRASPGKFFAKVDYRKTICADRTR
ncbi:hypothetical protein K3H47_02430 [Aeromonas veronii]|uniref:hypothetical protein n=1 Tax=Aeromonas veronii TaxID=654 RepID=UPI001F355A97|nr:hypothetical protein [Aeromonas veronii]MCF5762808.1 hypothetical protein [Aeromonas veronii]